VYEFTVALTFHLSTTKKSHHFIFLFLLYILNCSSNFSLFLSQSSNLSLSSLSCSPWHCTFYSSWNILNYLFKKKMCWRSMHSPTTIKTNETSKLLLTHSLSHNLIFSPISTICPWSILCHKGSRRGSIENTTHLSCDMWENCQSNFDEFLHKEIVVREVRCGVAHEKRVTGEPTTLTVNKFLSSILYLINMKK
jgi:hypothetical protein